MTFPHSRTLHPPGQWQEYSAPVVQQDYRQVRCPITLLLQFSPIVTRFDISGQMLLA